MRAGDGVEVISPASGLALVIIHVGGDENLAISTALIEYGLQVVGREPCIKGSSPCSIHIRKARSA